ncbi:hypothetical protein BC829DRAFT_405340 [Chytridium lagenaria]|nr:hypothetical protein BC829DRAFT_405340 [Chytridium lagenaria]
MPRGITFWGTDYNLTLDSVKAFCNNTNVVEFDLHDPAVKGVLDLIMLANMVPWLSCVVYIFQNEEFSAVLNSAYPRIRLAHNLKWIIIRNTFRNSHPYIESLTQGLHCCVPGRTSLSDRITLLQSYHESMPPGAMLKASLLTINMTKSSFARLVDLLDKSIAYSANTEMDALECIINSIRVPKPGENRALFYFHAFSRSPLLKEAEVHSLLESTDWLRGRSRAKGEGARRERKLTVHIRNKTIRISDTSRTKQFSNESLEYLVSKMSLHADMNASKPLQRLFAKPRS